MYTYELELLMNEAISSNKDINLGDGYYKHLRTSKKDHNEIYKLVNGKKVGSILYWDQHSENKELYNLDVDPKYRKQGIGGKLLDLGIKEFKPTRIAVAKDNKVAYNMYRKRGFREFISFKNPDDNNKNTWYMKPINKR